MKAFIENIGHASTTAWLYSKRLGHSVNAAAYYHNEKKRVFVVMWSNVYTEKGAPKLLGNLPC